MFLHECAEYRFSNFLNITRTTNDYTLYILSFVSSYFPYPCTVYVCIRNVLIQLLFTIRENFCLPTNLLQFVYGSLCRLPQIPEYAFYIEF